MTDTDMLHMAAMEKENMELWKLLRETLPVLRAAIFTDYKDTSKANELYDRIVKKVGKE
ncbi:MAG: hypothetical protein K5898_03525 [Ruminococcus sp.]|uniref:hypothetical protein n=1 Tax=Ruminococcus sp. TaxID=41978 RepID=UPI0025DBD9D1|nr:hypothetical protein [Ruminococcus sp.]MCR4794238.1 hypothetical protein [Ruminococcus sp.]